MVVIPSKVHRGVLPAALQDLHGALHPRRPGDVLHRPRRLLRSRPQPPKVRRGRGEIQGCKVGDFIGKFSKTGEIWTPIC